MDILELSENIKNILEEAQQISNATAQAKSMMDMSEVQLQKLEAIYDDMTHQLTELYNESESLLKISEMKNNIREDILNDNTMLRGEAQSLYKQYQELNNALISREQMGETVDQKSVELEEIYTKQGQVFQKQINDLDEEILKEENKAIYLKEAHDEYMKLLHDLNVVKSDLRNIRDSDNFRDGELDISGVLERCQIIEKEMNILASQQEDIDRKIKEKTSYIDQKLIEENTILEDDELKNTFENIDTEFSELENSLSTSQSRENELINTLKTIMQEINETESKIRNIEREEIIITDIVKSTVATVDEEILTYDLSITKKQEDLHREHDIRTHVENDLRDINEKITSKRQDLLKLGIDCEEELQELTKMKQTEIKLIEENNKIPNETESVKEEIKNARDELDIIEQQPQTIMKEHNDEILKANESEKCIEELMNEKLNESQKKVSEIETQNNDTYNIITSYETKLKEIKECIVETRNNLSKDYNTLKSLDAEYENLSADIKVVQIKKSSKTIPKIPYAYFASPNVRANITKPHNIKHKHHKSIPDNMSDTSTEGETITYADYLKRRNAKATSKKAKK